MKIVQINAVDSGSTGRIMFNIAKEARTAGVDMFTFSSSRKAIKPDAIQHTYFDNKIDYYFHMIAALTTGLETSFSYFATRRLIRKLKTIKPDIIHLHITHGFYLNHPLFFEYIKKSGVRVIWTLHDCWTFTGRCPHFQITGCYRWKNGCGECIYGPKLYPGSYFFDLTARQWKAKKSMFTGVQKMMLVTPSQWLAGLVTESFLGEYPVKVINNGIDLSVFKPSQSDFRTQYQIPKDKKIILGVAFNWGYRKGLDIFIELAKIMDENKYQVVLVGTNEKVDQQLPENIISIHRTQNQRELAQIYSAADVFLNPTREDNYPTVNMEAIACGTPVVTFKTGGSPEIITERTGIVLSENTAQCAIDAIQTVCESNIFSEAECSQAAKSFDMNDRFKEYVKLYSQIME